MAAIIIQVCCYGNQDDYFVLTLIQYIVNMILNHKQLRLRKEQLDVCFRLNPIVNEADWTPYFIIYTSLSCQREIKNELCIPKY